MPCSCSEWSSWKQNYMPGLETAPALPDKLLSLSDNDYIIHTSSTAQGGGGSFKNRKPIGEIGCCESRWQSESTEMKAALGRMGFLAGPLKHARPFLALLYKWTSKLGVRDFRGDAIEPTAYAEIFPGGGLPRSASSAEGNPSNWREDIPCGC